MSASMQFTVENPGYLIGWTTFISHADGKLAILTQDENGRGTSAQVLTASQARLLAHQILGTGCFKGMPAAPPASDPFDGVEGHGGAA